jgi:hypothetical protein
VLFRIFRDDISNAFKMYRRTVIAGIQIRETQLRAWHR